MKVACLSSIRRHRAVSLPPLIFFKKNKSVDNYLINKKIMISNSTIGSTIELSPLSTGCDSSEKLPDQFRDDTLIDLLFDLLDIWTMLQMSKVCVAWRRKIDGQSNGSELQQPARLWLSKWEQIYGITQPAFAFTSDIGTSSVYHSMKHLCFSVYWKLDEEMQDSEAEESKRLFLDTLMRCENRLSVLQRKFAEETHWGRRVFITSVDEDYEDQYCKHWERDVELLIHCFKLNIFPRHRDPMLGPITVSFQYTDIDAIDTGLWEFWWRDSPGTCDTQNRPLFKRRMFDISDQSVSVRHEFFRLNDAIFGKGNWDDTDKDEACRWLHSLLRQALVYGRKSNADGDDGNADLSIFSIILDNVEFLGGSYRDQSSSSSSSSDDEYVTQPEMKRRRTT